MISRTITAIACIPAYCGDMPAELRQTLSAGIAKPMLKRMSDSDLLMSALLKTMQPEAGDAVVTVSTYAQSRMLEEYIDSFPTPSPLRFQKSVHPSSVQQHCVALQKPLCTYIPLAGLQNSPIIALRTALCRSESTVILAIVEETGTWTCNFGAASKSGYAFALKLCNLSECNSPELVMVEWDAIADDSATDSTPADFHAAVAQRKNFHAAHPDIGQVSIRWK